MKYLKRFSLVFTALLLPIICVGQQSPQMIYNLGKDAFKAGNHGETIARAQQAKNALGQTNPKIEALLAQAYFQSGDIVEAKIAYEKLLALTPAAKQQADSFKPFITLGKQIDEALGKADREHQQNISRRRMEEADKIIAGYQEKEDNQRERLRQESKGPQYYFSKAQNTGDIQAYEDFKKSFPDTDLARKADKEVNDLKEKRKINILKKNRTQVGKTLVDPRDGQRYRTVIISKYVFMAENLNYAPGSIASGVDTDNPKPYGRLYSFYSAQNACPPGWKLPDSYFWARLWGDISFDYSMDEGVSTKGQIGNLFKSRYGWKPGAENNGYDTYGFKALPVGYGTMYKHNSGSYKFNTYRYVGYLASFWTSRTTKFDDQVGLAVEFSSDNTNYDIKQRKKTRHLASCRCYKVKEKDSVETATSNTEQNVGTTPEKQTDNSENTFTIVEKQPSIIGGMAALYQKIRYPQEAIQSNIEGTVMVQFVVTEEGNVENAKVIKGIGAGCDQEALRVIKGAKFIPGKQKGKPVNVRLTIPITFRLN